MTKPPRKRMSRKRLTSSDLLDRSLDDAYKIALRHSGDNFNHVAHEAALCFIRALTELKKEKVND